MDYLEWELERQRGALRTLLGGGGRDKKALRADGAGQEPAEAGAAGGNALGPVERSAAFTGVEGGYPAAQGAVCGAEAGYSADRETARGAGADRPEGRDGGPDSPGSAWERVPAGEEAPLERRAGTERQAPDASRRTPREGTGPQAASGAHHEDPASGAESIMSHTGEYSAGSPGGGTTAGSRSAVWRLARRRPLWAPEPGDSSGGSASWEGGTALRAEDGARALSRAVQRDARRYDGGFTIY